MAWLSSLLPCNREHAGFCDWLAGMLDDELTMSSRERQI